jgi:hypothetical protein
MTQTSLFDRGLEGQKNRVDVDAEPHETEVGDRIKQHQNDEDVGGMCATRWLLPLWGGSGFLAESID